MHFIFWDDVIKRKKTKKSVCIKFYLCFIFNFFLLIGSRFIGLNRINNLNIVNCVMNACIIYIYNIYMNQKILMHAENTHVNVSVFCLCLRLYCLYACVYVFCMPLL